VTVAVSIPDSITIIYFLQSLLCLPFDQQRDLLGGQMESEWALIFRGVKRILQVHYQWTGEHKARCTRCQTSRRKCLSVISLLLCLMQQPEEDEANAEGSEAHEGIQPTACPESMNSTFLFIEF